MGRFFHRLLLQLSIHLAARGPLNLNCKLFLLSKKNRDFEGVKMTPKKHYENTMFQINFRD